MAMNKLLAIFAIVLFFIATVAMAAPTKEVTIAASAEVTTGLVIGVGLVGITLMAVFMLMDIQAGTIGAKKEQ